MHITGPTLRLRPSDFADWPLFRACYDDWPVDQHGQWTNERAMREADIAHEKNRHVAAPLTVASDWQQSLVIYTDDLPQGMGLQRAAARGTVVTVLNQLFLPSERGKGRMAELQMLLQRYAFEVLGASEAGYDIMRDESPAALAHVRNRAKYEHVGNVPGHGERPLHRGRVTREAWAAWQDAHSDEAAIRFEWDPIAP